MIQTKNQQKSLFVKSAHRYTGKPVSFLTKEHYKDVTQQRNLSGFVRAFVYFTLDQFTSLSFSSDLTVTSVKLLLQQESLIIQTVAMRSVNKILSSSLSFPFFACSV